MENLKINKINDYLNQSIKDINYLKDQSEAIKDVVNVIKNSKLVYLAGNGGSSANASHFANDLNKMCKISAICLSDNTPILTAVANDISYRDIFSQQINRKFIELFGKDNVTLVVVSGSGNSRNVLDVIHYGKALGLNVIAFLGMTGGVASNIKGIHKIHINTDMQHAEDIHMILVHTIVRMICNEMI